MQAPRSRFHGLPRTDRVLARPDLVLAHQQLGAAVTKSLVRSALEQARRDIDEGGVAPGEDVIASRVALEAERFIAARSRRVINATGVILHTNLGRAPLSKAAREALAQPGYLSLELNLRTGKRGGRAAFVEAALQALTGAEAALVVNNNAAAVMLALGSIALGRSVVVSRGELVEIGGGFRVPAVIERSGARLVEVGTTNRTRVEDFERALATHADAVAILRVHPGNFKQIGFVERPSLPELVALGRARGVRVVEDLGGGTLLPLRGLTGDPIVRDSVAAGADIVTFSTDKSLGGPQGGVLVGKADVIAAARRDPLHRALRLGRLPIVALEATLAAYLAGDLDSIPAVSMVQQSADALRVRAEHWAAELEASGIAVRVALVEAVSGGGTYAEEKIPSVGVVLAVAEPDAFAATLRASPSPVFVRIEEGAVVLDARTVQPDEDGALLDSLRWAWERSSASIRGA